MKSFSVAAAAAAVFGLANAHMEMSWPPPFRSRNNPHTTDIDYNLVDPLHPSGSNYPCKGYHSLLDTPQGASVVNWDAGQSYNFTIIGGATHNGGSCQAALSYDGGNSWTAIHSYVGNCPLQPTWEFNLPSDVPGGSALFAWTWFNNIGNREMYMNCAHVTINGGGSGGGDFGGRPGILVANVDNGCSTTEGFDVEFPNPGPDVDNVSARSAPPVGNCGGARRYRSLQA